MTPTQKGATKKIKSVAKSVAKKKTEKKTKKKLDKYDRAIAYLLEAENFNDVVMSAWTNQAHNKTPASCLFQYASPTGLGDLPHQFAIGCLTQIRSFPHYNAWTPELTWQIKNDETLPKSSYEVTPESLERFAYYQRKMDRTIRRKKTAKV